MFQDYLQLSVPATEVGSHQLIIIQQWSESGHIYTKENHNLISNWFIKPKDLDFNQKVSPTILFELVASTSNSRNYPNSLASTRIHLDCTQAQLWLVNPCASMGRFITSCFSKQLLVIYFAPEPNQEALASTEKIWLGPTINMTWFGESD